MTLTDYIKQVGVAEFCKQFKVPQRVAISYQYKARRPRPQLAEKIVSSTPVTWEGIYGSESRAS